MNVPPQRRPLTPMDLVRIIWHLPKFIKLYWRLLWDRRVPLLPKLLLLGAAAYFVAPIDVMPDFLVPLLGSVDDLVVFAVACRGFIALCPKDVVVEHVRRLDAGG